MNAAPPPIERPYLLICPIPHAADDRGGIWLDRLWHHDLCEHLTYLRNFVLLSPRPGRVSRIVTPNVDHTKTPDEIRRDRAYLDTVDEIWGMLRQYV